MKVFVTGATGAIGTQLIPSSWPAATTSSA